MSRTDNYGPLSLQMGSATGAVDDLVHGYEQLVHSLPNLTSQVANVHADTEEMAKHLEYRTRSLVDGYEYLQGLSTQLPEMFRETASAHRKTLQDAIHLLTPEEKAKIADQQQVLDKVRCELQSISHERVIMDVLMRPTINETRRLYMQAQSATDRTDQQRSTRSLAKDTYSTAKQPSPTTTPHTHTYSHNNTTSASSRAPITIRLNNTVRTGTTASADRSGNTNPVSYNHTTIVDLNTPIHIPEYNPNDLNTTDKHRPASTAPGQFTGYSQNNPFSEPRLVARAVGGALMVPNMRRGALPSEVQALRTQPSAAVSAAEYMEAEMQRRLRVKRRKVRRSATRIVTLEKESLAKSLAEKLEHTDEEVSGLKRRLMTANQKFNADQKNAILKLQAVVKELQEGQGGRDEALLRAVQKLLQESMSTKQPENRDAEILRALESLLVPPKRVAVIDRLHEYKVLTARSKTEIPHKQAPVAHTVPVIVPVPAPTEVIKPTSVEVQTEPIPVPEAPIPAPVPAPAPVIINVPAPPAPVSMEKDLIDLMRSVVDTQHQTMQGNQALILSLIHERSTQPAPVQCDEPSEESVEPPTPPRAPSPEPIVVPPPEPAPAVKPAKPAYSTAFGSVVLGGELMVGPYTTPAVVVPPALQPCVLRGVPHPVPRRAAMPPVNGPTEGSSEDTVSAVLSVSAKDGVDEGNLENKNVNANTAETDEKPVDPTPSSAITAIPTVCGPESAPPIYEGVAVGLQGSGGSSTAGRGGSQQHSTPGQTQKVDLARIPPHMRRVASDFTMRALRSTPSATTTTTGTSSAASLECKEHTTTPSSAPELLTLLQNLHTLSTHIAATPPVVTVTPELISQKVSEGVQLGVKEALGLLDTHTRHSTYYNPSHNTHSDRHKSVSKQTLTQNNTTTVPTTTSQTVYISATDKPDDKMRESLVLLKSRRGGGRSTRTQLEVEEELKFQQHAQCLTSRQLPHRSNRRKPTGLRYSSEGEHYHHNYTAARQHTTQQQYAQQRQEHKNILADVEFSRFYAQKLLNVDENSSFNDSVSLDEDTAAFLRDPLTHTSSDHVDSVTVSTDLSCDGDNHTTTTTGGVHKNLRLIYRNEHEKRHSEVFSTTAPPLVHTDLVSQPQRSPTNSVHVLNSRDRHVHPASSAGVIVPLVSHVLYQSATEEALQRHGGIGAGTMYDSIDGAHTVYDSVEGAHTVYDSVEGAHTVLAASMEGSTDAALWNLNTSALRPTATTTTTTATTTAAGSNLRLLQRNSNFPTATTSGDHRLVLSSSGSASIVTASSADSTTHSWADEQQRSAGHSPGSRRSPASKLPIRQSTTSGSSRGNGGRSVSSSCSSSSDLVSSYDNSVSPSTALHRHSQHRRASRLPLPTTTTSHYNHNNTTKPYQQQYCTTSHDATEADTDRLAAQMMLTALDLHRPSNYHTKPHLHNPVASHLPKHHSLRPHSSRIYTADSDSDVESDNNSVHNSIEQELNFTGSSCSSDDELLERANIPTTTGTSIGGSRGRGNVKTGIKLMGVGTTRKMLYVRK